MPAMVKVLGSCSRVGREHVYEGLSGRVGEL